MLASGYAIAPANEPRARSERIIAERKLAGFRIEVEVAALQRTTAKKPPNGFERSGFAQVKPTLRLYRLPSGELLDETQFSLTRSVASGEHVSDAGVLKESLLGKWTRFRSNMEP
jgi:hypothetical protein